MLATFAETPEDRFTSYELFAQMFNLITPQRYHIQPCLSLF